MDEATIALTIMTGLLLISFFGFLVWGIRSGQFQNVEDAKYLIFRTNRESDVSSKSKREDLKGGEE